MNDIRKYINLMESMSSEVDLKSLIVSLKSEIPFFKYSHVNKHLVYNRKKFIVIQVSSSPTFVDGSDHAFHETESGITIWIYKNEDKTLEIVDLGIAEEFQGQGYATKIIDILTYYFPGYTMLISDASEGFWAYLIRRYPNLKIL